MSSRFVDLLRNMVEVNASDLFLKVGVIPSYRLVGKLEPQGEIPLGDDEMKGIFDEVMDERTRRLFDEHGEVDIVYEVSGIARYRGNVFRQRGYTGMVFRSIKAKIPAMEELKLPADTLKKLAEQPRGIVLLTGITGCGKSTTLATMIEHLNQTQRKHIVTIEDPIEYTFKDKLSVVNQREIGYDTNTFSNALRASVRQSPDVILIGELRDRETMEAAFNAAETGHLVLSTLHSPNAMQAVDRMINFFEPHEHAFLKLQMSLLLEGVISQRLLPTKDNSRRVVAVEIMAATPTIRELLLAGKTRELYKAVKEGGFFGCQTFNQALKQLLDADLIHLEDALNAADSPDELQLELRGISKETGSASSALDAIKKAEAAKKPPGGFKTGGGKFR